jgi:hypothetical protein
MGDRWTPQFPLVLARMWHGPGTAAGIATLALASSSPKRSARQEASDARCRRHWWPVDAAAALRDAVA